MPLWKITPNGPTKVHETGLQKEKEDFNLENPAFPKFLEEAYSAFPK